MMSMITRSGLSWAAACTALDPSDATRAVQPSAVMRCAIAVASVGSSSTTRTVRGVACRSAVLIMESAFQSSGTKNTAPRAGIVSLADQSREWYSPATASKVPLWMSEPPYLASSVVSASRQRPPLGSGTW